jgi:threonine dehydratase
MGAPQISAADVERARAAGDGVVTRTPVIRSAALSDLQGVNVVLKAESLQRTGSFKLRGALAKLAALGDRAAPGVTAGSAGNHAQALAFAARHRGVACEIFVPAGTPLSKIAGCREYGASVVEGGATLDEAVAAARERADEAGMVFCHPFDDLDVIAGQATVGLEIVADVVGLARVVLPLGGGGLLAGVASVVKAHDPRIEVIGVQAAACAPYSGHAAAAGAVVTLADGIAVKHPGAITGPMVESLADRIVVVDEDHIADAMMLLIERSKLAVEGAGAVGVAALLGGLLPPPPTGTTCIVLSGGNVDLGVLPGLIRRHETRAGRRLTVFARINDRPGELARLLEVFAEHGANLLEVEHVREGIDLHVRETGVQIALEVRGHAHAEAVVAAARARGYALDRIDGR